MTVNRPPVPRPSLDALPSYKPGKPPVGGVAGYKLSSNENPYGPLPSVLKAVQGAAEAFNRYPDYYGQAAVEKLAHSLDVPVDSVVLGPGSVGVLEQIVLAMCEPTSEVVFAWRSFEAYPIVVQVAGAKPVMVPLTADGRHDLDAMYDAITDDTAVVFVCTPNNPTGPTVKADELEAFLDRVPRNVLVVIDEAYTEFVEATDAPDALNMFRTRQNVAVLRTFSKAYGLAGLRVGYGVLPPELADAVRKTMVPFSVSALAQVAVIESLDAESELRARVDDIVAERRRVVAALKEQGWNIPDAQGNFVWLGLGDRAAEFAQAAGEKGVSVRAFPGEGVRVTIAEPEGNDLFLDVARGFVS